MTFYVIIDCEECYNKIYATDGITAEVILDVAKEIREEMKNHKCGE